MKILQQPVKLKRGARVKVNLSRPAVVYLMTEVNFKRYKDGSSFKRLGGQFNSNIAEFTAPYDGTWHAVIEKGSHFSPQPITGSVEVLPPQRKEIPYFTDEEEASNAVPAAEPAKAESPAPEAMEEDSGADQQDASGEEEGEEEK